MLFEVDVRKIAEAEIRVEANSKEEAREKALEIAKTMEIGDWDEEEIVVGLAGRAEDYHENEIKFVGDFLVCACGNTPDSDGFTTTSTYGIPVEPEADKWDGKTYRCDHCGSVKSVEKVVV